MYIFIWSVWEIILSLSGQAWKLKINEQVYKYIDQLTLIFFVCLYSIACWIDVYLMYSFLKHVGMLQVLEFLANPEDDSRHEERQQALMELLQAGGLKQVDEEKLLSMAENAKL